MVAQSYPPTHKVAPFDGTYFSWKIKNERKKV